MKRERKEGAEYTKILQAGHFLSDKSIKKKTKKLFSFETLIAGIAEVATVAAKHKRIINVR